MLKRLRIGIDKKEKDFSKLFDMVNYKILIKKLEKYGIKHQYIDWFKSYLNSWKQYVCYSKGTMLHVVPLRGQFWFHYVSDIC